MTTCTACSDAGELTLTAPDDNQATSHRSSVSVVRSHRCEVTMPDGATATVEYQRFSPRWHLFSVAAPYHQRIYQGTVISGVAAIEDTARALAPALFAAAQEDERKEMRRKTPPPGQRRGASGTPSLTPKIAQQHWDGTPSARPAVQAC